MNSILDTIISNLTIFKDRNAFYINEKFYTYADLSKKIAGINEEIKNIPEQTALGVLTNDSLETYASIISLWFNNLIFVPISPSNSKDRNKNSIEQAEIEYILTPTVKDAEIINLENIKLLETASLSANSKIENKNTEKENILYILFTSGSTGTPKGVPISLNNLDAFIKSFLAIGYNLDETDKFLQIYDLSFDASVHCYVLPLFLGAGIYTIPTNEVKYLYAYKLMKEQELTFVKMPPSTITYLQPYFSKINLTPLNYSLFGGEALPENLVKEWKKCVPNAKIHNVYGPTEATINCFYYEVSSNIKSFNSVVAIGKPMKGITAVVIDENNIILSENQKGELCVAGDQITTGYWGNSKKNKSAFIEITDNNNKVTFYKTGDIVYFDNEQDFYYCERKDYQVQIQGYRVELGELEHHTRTITNLNHVISLAKTSKSGTNQLYLFLENYKGSIEQLKSDLAEKVPNYMLPQQIINLPSFPLSTSGKIDRNKLKDLI